MKEPPQIHGDGAKRRDVSGDKRLVFAVVAAEIENPRGQKSKCCLYLCHCLTLTPSFIHLDILEAEKRHESVNESKADCSVLYSLTPPPSYVCLSLSGMNAYKAPFNPHIPENVTAGMGLKRLDGDIHIDTSHTFHSQIGCFCIVAKNPRVT